MRPQPDVVVAESADALAHDTARRTLEALGAALRARAVAHLVVTGGSILEAVLAELAAADAHGPIDWARVHVWWGDERYVPSDSDERNDLPARAEAFDRLPLSAAVLHPMPASDGASSGGSSGGGVEAAAADYAAQLAAAVPSEHAGESVPRFDVVLLGIGPDGHCASLFPEHPGVFELELAVVAVHNSPKPPPDRISLTFPTLDAADEIWVVASGDGKSDAVARALGGAKREQVPSAGPRGRRRTLWLLDRDAAAKLPSGA